MRLDVMEVTTGWVYNVNEKGLGTERDTNENARLPRIASNGLHQLLNLNEFHYQSLTK